jgi:hypothetical protein
MQTQPLSPTDIKKLEQNLGLTRQLVIFVAVGLLILLLLAPSMIQGINSMILVPAVLMLVGFFVWAINRMGGKMQKDLKNGVKLVFQTKVEEKILGNSNSFVLVLNGERELVTKEDYDLVSVGDLLEFEKTPLSNTFLRLRKL